MGSPETRKTEKSGKGIVQAEFYILSFVLRMKAVIEVQDNMGRMHTEGHLAVSIKSQKLVALG